MTYHRERHLADLPRLILSEGAQIAYDLQSSSLPRRQRALDSLERYARVELDRLTRNPSSWVACQTTYNALASIWHAERELLQAERLWTVRAA